MSALAGTGPSVRFVFQIIPITLGKLEAFRIFQGKDHSLRVDLEKVSQCHFSKLSNPVSQISSGRVPRSKNGMEIAPRQLWERV